MNCPCESGKTFKKCCETFITGAKEAETAEQLMRARYTAYTQVEMDFLKNSVHPDFRKDEDGDGAQDWAENSEWHGLEILACEIFFITAPI